MIGVFDSGIGGLTVIRALIERNPAYDLIYFGDTARAPYGNKNPETIARYAIENIGFLINQGSTLIVMACHAASATVTAGLIRDKFDLPVLEVIPPAVAHALQVTRHFKIGIIGTRATIQSGMHAKKISAINAAASVFSVACPLLVPLVEEGWLKKPETASIVKKYLLALKVRQIDTLILGSTHYPMLKGLIQRKIGQRVHVSKKDRTTGPCCGSIDLPGGCLNNISTQPASN
jgi:glutamate racemase